MAKIYISSTYSDLEECREKVYRSLRQMRHDVIAMEDYVATDERPLNKCLADVADCDVYIGLFAWRYGYVPTQDNPDQKSITELEFRHAVATNKKCLIFLLHEDAPWPRSKMESGPGATQLEALRAELGRDYTVGFFHNCDELGGLVTAAVHNWEVEYGEAKPTGPTIPEINLQGYYAKLSERYQRLDLEALTPPQREEYLQIQLRQVFVAQNVRQNPPPLELPKGLWQRLQETGEVEPEDLPAGLKLEDVRRAQEAYSQKPSQPILEVLATPGSRKVVILGDPGSGKSTLTRFLILSLIETDLALLPEETAESQPGLGRWQEKFTNHLPLLIELRHYAGQQIKGHCQDFLEFWHYLGQTEGYHLDRAAVRHYLQHEGRAVVIFDGLDEIFDLDHREAVARQIAGFASDYPQAHVIVTSRIVGYSRKLLTDAGFANYTLQDLDETQIEQFVRQWYGLALHDRAKEAADRRERILKAVRESPSVHNLAGNPMLLTIMAIIGKHQELPRERWKLYDHAATVLVHHWDVMGKHLADSRLPADLFGEEDKKELLRNAAFAMQSRPQGLAGNYIPGRDLQAEFEAYLQKRYTLPPAEAIPTARAMIQQFRARNFILCRYGSDLYGFVHRSFLEYFCAAEFVYRFEKTRELSIEGLQQIFADHWADRSWHEVLRLICGMLDEKFAGQLIGFLTHNIGPADWQQAPDRQPWNIVLAVQCLSEIRNLNEIAEPASNLLRVILSLLQEKQYTDIDFQGFSHDHLIPAGLAIGPSWPGREQIIEWVLGFEKYPKQEFYFARSSKDLGEFAAHLAGDVKGIRQAVGRLLLSLDGEMRIAGLNALVGGGWLREINILSLFQNRAVNDAAQWVRQAAVEALAEHWPEDQQTLLLVRDRAVNDTDEMVRRAVVRTLAEHWPENDQTLLLVRDRAVNDPSHWVRRAAVEALAEHWPEDGQTLLLVRDRAVNDAAQQVRRAVVKTLAEHWPEDQQTLLLVRDRAVNDPAVWVRQDAVRILAQHWQEDEQILLLLREWAVNDTNEIVRRAAVRVLAQYWPENDQILLLLQDRALNDPEQGVRRAAVEALAEYWSENDQTLPLLRDQALNDAEEWIRQAAVEALAEYWPEDEQTLPLLRDRAVNDAYEDVRQTAVEALAQHWSADEQTLSLIRDRAANDVGQRVRQTAVEALAQHWPADEQTLPLVRDRAVNDADQRVRETAVAALAEHWPEDQQTLPLLRDRAVNDTDEGVQQTAVAALAQHYWNLTDTRSFLWQRLQQEPAEDIRGYIEWALKIIDLLLAES